MKDILFDNIKIFLEKNLKNKNLKNKKKMLLAYSGGYDSKALLYLLCKCKKYFQFDLHIAHIDHSWRKESEQEAILLQKEAIDLNIPFHLKKLPPVEKKTNLEAIYRNYRYQFFKTLFDKHNFDALLLAHQKDDLSETVLKRFLEGADLTFLKGMESTSTYDQMIIWRPLLNTSKKDLQLWLKKNNLKAIEDKTNRDITYLRARMREKIVPMLSEQFGKKISENLVLASLRSLELKNYLDKKIQKYLQHKVIGPFGLYLNCETFIESIENIELTYLLKTIFKNTDLDVSRTCIERLIFALKYKQNFNLKMKNGLIIIYEKIFFILTSPIFENKFLLNKVFLNVNNNDRSCSNKKKLGKWNVNIQKTKKIESKKYGCWQEIFKGEVNVILPKGKYFFKIPEGSFSYYGKKLTKWYCENKIPPFIRFCFPVIFKEDKMFYEFLSGKKRFKEKTIKDFYKISLKLSD